MSTERTGSRVIQRAKGRPSVSRKEIERAIDGVRARRSGKDGQTQTTSRHQRSWR